MPCELVVDAAKGVFAVTCVESAAQASGSEQVCVAEVVRREMGKGRCRIEGSGVHVGGAGSSVVADEIESDGCVTTTTDAVETGVKPISVSATAIVETVLVIPTASVVRDTPAKVLVVTVGIVGNPIDPAPDGPRLSWCVFCSL